jgi:TPR repeat protein
MAAEKSNPDAQNRIGYFYLQGLGVSQDYDKAINWFYKAAAQGLPEAQNNLGYMYLNGWGVLQDYEKAMEWLVKAAEQSNPAAQNSIGVMYFHGLGIPQDYSEAMKWYSLAAEQGEPLAQFNLGHMYSDIEPFKDRVRGYQWLIIAAANDDKVAKNKAYLVEIFMSPDQIAEAQKLAREWIQKHEKKE